MLNRLCILMEKKPKNKLFQEIEVPQGINVIMETEFIILKKDNNEIKRKLNPVINVKNEGNKIIIDAKKSTKREKKMFGTTVAHINNMIKGLTENFKYKLQF